MLAASRRRVSRHPFDGSHRDPSAARGPRRRTSCRFRRFNRSRARRSGAGLGINWPSESTARCRCRDPRQWPPTAGGWSGCSSDLTGERDKPATLGSHGCRRHDPCGSLLEAPSEFPGGLMRAHAAESRQSDVVAVGLDADGTGSESARIRGPAFALAFGETHPRSGVTPMLAVLPVLECRASPSRPDEYASLEF
jgi:hypothetical protein